MKTFGKSLIHRVDVPLNKLLKYTFLFLLTTTLFNCTKQDIIGNEKNNATAAANIFFSHSIPLNPSVNLVLNDIRKKMSDNQINNFIGNAGLIYWDKSKAYMSPKLNNTIYSRSAGDSIVVMPIALPEQENINGALVAHIYNNGDSIIYSTHYKNHFDSIDSTTLPEYNITARELYVLGMAQLDADVFGHKKFISDDSHLKFGQQANPLVNRSGLAFISLTSGTCEYTFTYSSAVVFPPVNIYTYTASCGSPILLPPAVFLQGLDESYGLVYYSSVPVGEGGGGGPSSPYQLEFSSFYNSLTANQQAFLENTEYGEYYHGFIDYLTLHQFSQEAKDHVVWCINYLTSPTTLITTFTEFAAIYLNDFPTLSFLSQDDQNWLNNYPYLKSRIYYLLQNQLVIDAEDKIQFHITKLRNDGSYFTFNTAYSTFPQYKSIWFNDANYLYNLGDGAFGDWAINYLMQYPTMNFEYFQNEFMPSPYPVEFDYSNLDNPVFVSDNVVQMPVGFNFEFQNFNAVPDPPIRTIGKTDPRKNSEDTTWGTDCDATDILSNMPNFTDQQLFDEVEDLFHKTSNGSLETVGDQMIARFRNSVGGTYTNSTLSQIVFENSKFKSFIIKFGIRLNIALANANWNINDVNVITMPEEQRPIFNNLHNKFNGLQILINDTEETIIELTGFSVNATTHKWTANLNIIIKDHFGLDKHDALTYQDYHAGFAAWWILQHCRGYKPFETQIKIKMNLVSN